MISRKSNIKNQTGQSLFEVVFTAGLVALILLAVTSLAVGSVRNSSFSKINARAAKYAQEQVEWLRGKRDGNWDDFVANIDSGCSETFSWGDECIIEDFFIREATFQCYFFNSNTDRKTSRSCSSDTTEINIVDVEVKVMWTDLHGNHETQLMTSFSNWR